MPAPLFDFDVFLSFASADAEASKEIWQTLSQGGLRVFWATDTLKEVVGQSFVGAIQDNLIKSQHFVLLWTAQAKRSAWVRAEYEAFYSQCHLKDARSRRLVVMPDGLEPISSLPPFLQSLQIARSSPEIVTLLGGVDPQRLLRENRELQAAVGKLEARLSAAQKELDLAKRSVVAAPSTRAEAPRAAKPAAEKEEGEVLRALEDALDQIEVATGTSMGGAWINETGAFQAWKILYAQGGERVIRSLSARLANPKRDWQDQWKALTLLTYASRTPEGRERAEEIIAVASDLVLRGGYVKKAALELIAGVPAPVRAKWEALFPLVQSAPIEKIGELVRRLPEFTPPEERGRTAEVIGEILAFTTQTDAITATVGALKALNARSQLPRLREVMAEAPIEKANSLADLAEYFGDREAVPTIRQAIETWRHGAKPIRSLLTSLQSLEGSACHAYLAEVLLDSQPQRQREILSGLAKSNDPALLDAVAHLAEGGTDPEVREAAKKYLVR
ncbi:MAG TPA: toll/interleukin-1 receptor domain-containing protein [Thermoanaerobaculia bacterium]|nr:toll/interleukin-1 receptor domain-containing protein [Thermoanaerobaculia bacterium]